MERIWTETKRPQDVNFLISARNAGQMIEIAYAHGGEVIYRRTTNRSSGAVHYESRPYTEEELERTIDLTQEEPA